MKLVKSKLLVLVIKKSNEESKLVTLKCKKVRKINKKNKKKVFFYLIFERKLKKVKRLKKK